LPTWKQSGKRQRRKSVERRRSACETERPLPLRASRARGEDNQSRGLLGVKSFLKESLIEADLSDGCFQAGIPSIQKGMFEAGTG